MVFRLIFDLRKHGEKLRMDAFIYEFFRRRVRVRYPGLLICSFLKHREDLSVPCNDIVEQINVDTSLPTGKK